MVALSTACAHQINIEQFPRGPACLYTVTYAHAYAAATRAMSIRIGLAATAALSDRTEHWLLTAFKPVFLGAGVVCPCFAFICLSSRMSRRTSTWGRSND